MSTDLLALAAMVTAALAAAILLWFLVRRPPLSPTTKILLFFGLGALPIASAFSGNVVGYQETQTRRFCGSCHVMEPYTDDAADPASETLPAIHSRNAMFGDKSCYTCHADYGMYGTVTTKLAGLKHVYHYYGSYKDLSIEEALPTLELYKPFPNANCTHCHSTTLAEWRQVPDHQGLLDELDGDQVSCASSGCHGPAHPFSKAARKAAEQAP